MAFLLPVLVASLALVNPTVAQSVDGSKYNSPTAGPPSSYFAAATSIPVAALKSAAAKANTAAKDATYPINNSGGAAKVTIHSDWSKFSEYVDFEGAAFVWVADMDVDCDGIDYKCKGNQDGQSETNFGALAAYEVPWIVIPDKFGTTYQECPSRKQCFVAHGPDLLSNDDLNGNAGHGSVDVTYILFTGKDSVLPSSALNKNYITNFGTLRSMGDSLMGSLAKNLGLSGGSETSTTTGSAPATTCSWSGHCLGASCSTENDCSDNLVCTSGKCANP
ncbi:hypothetical protein N7513_013190 [Penicillium frequentans]|nr:hypothetical protein N7513_013190 [Penicillium glabrum]